MNKHKCTPMHFDLHMTTQDELVMLEADENEKEEEEEEVWTTGETSMR